MELCRAADAAKDERIIRETFLNWIPTYELIFLLVPEEKTTPEALTIINAGYDQVIALNKVNVQKIAIDSPEEAAEKICSILEGKIAARPKTYEVEEKYRIADSRPIKEALAGLGFSNLGTLRQKDMYYLISKDGYLRLRYEGGRSTLTFKGRNEKNDVKVRQEIVLNLPKDDGEQLEKIFECVSLKKTLVVDKERENWVFGPMPDKITAVFGGVSGKIIVSFDLVKNLGSFMEIEVRDKNVQKAEQTIRKVMEKVGLKKEQVEGRAYYEMLTKT